MESIKYPHIKHDGASVRERKEYLFGDPRSKPSAVLSYQGYLFDSSVVKDASYLKIVEALRDFYIIITLLFLWLEQMIMLLHPQLVYTDEALAS